MVIRPCVRCGAVDRFASGGCRPCAARRAAALYDPVKHAERARAYYQANRERILAERKAPEKAEARRAYQRHRQARLRRQAKEG